MPGDFSQKLGFGQVGEGLISRWLQSRGCSIFPAYEMETEDGKAKPGPRMFSASGNLILPDMLAFGGREMFWVEAKRKTCFAWNRNREKWVTGIDQHHYEQYQEVAEKTGLPVWIMFWHPHGNPSHIDTKHDCPEECPTGLFGDDIRRLVLNESHRWPFYGRSGMVYWAHESLRRIASVEDILGPTQQSTHAAE